MTTDASDQQPDLGSLAQQARWQVIKTVTSSKAGHIGGPLSMMDLLVCLYFGELDIRPEDPNWADRDRFILSKGHAAIGLYSVLALRGFLPIEELATFDKGDSGSRAIRTKPVYLGSTPPPAPSVRACPSGSASHSAHSSAARVFTLG